MNLSPKVQRALRVAALVTPMSFGACGSEGGAAADGPQVEIQTSPISYPGIAKVCFGLEVFNGQPGPGTDTVWAKSGLCSDAFGNGAGGAISYVGPCDASVGGDNYIALTLESISVDGGETLDDQTGSGIGFDGADFQNPCTADDRCFLHFKCEANKDTKVQFDLTVMRDADQGFFDIGIAFADVFCAAKVDTCTAPDAPIRLLYGDDIADPVGADRTAVAAVACTAGPDGFEHDFDTHLLFTSKVVSCNGGAVTFAVDATGKNEGDQTVQSADGGYTLHYASYFGAEQLTCGGYLVLDSENALLLDCPGGTCRITGVSSSNNWGGYGYTTQGVYYYRLQMQQGLQQQQAGLGYGSFYGGASSSASAAAGYGAGAGASALAYYDANGFEVIDPPLDGSGRVIGWTAQSETLSCNKTFFNTAIDVENLAGQGLADCALSFDATALASDDANGFDTATGTFAKAGGMYGAVHVPDVPLTGPGASLVCNAYPLDGTDLYETASIVHTKYIGTLVDDNPAFCFHSDNGQALGHFAGCGEDVVIPPVDCPAACTTCAPGNGVILQCQDNTETYLCEVLNAPANTLVQLFIGDGSGNFAYTNGQITSGTGEASFSGSSGYGAASVFWASVGGQTIANTANAICVDCEPGFQVGGGGFCESCPNNCAECGAFDCTQCEDGYTLDNGACVLDVGEGCGQHCAVCGDWDATLACAQSGDDFACSVTNGPASSDILIFNASAGGFVGATTDANGAVADVVVPHNDGDIYAALWQPDPDNDYVVFSTTLRECKECDGGYDVGQFGLCQQSAGPQ